MQFSDLLAELRERLDDKVEPFLWSDDRLKRFINEAQREAAERSRCLTDRLTTAVCQVVLDPSTRVYELDPRVIDVTRASLNRRPGCYLERIGDAWPTELTTGLADFFSVEENGGKKYLTVDRVPNATDPQTIVNLVVQRYPLVPLSADTDIPEIEDSRQLDMLWWAMFLAYDSRDPDSGSDSKAQSADARFTAAFGMKIDANVRRKQIRHQAPVTRPTSF